MSQHILGPWIARDRANHVEVTLADNNLFLVAKVSGFNMPEARANARLIAAAPEMLKALQAVRPYLADHVGMTLDEGPGDRIVLDLIDALLARIEKGDAQQRG